VCKIAVYEVIVKDDGMKRIAEDLGDGSFFVLMTKRTPNNDYPWQVVQGEDCEVCRKICVVEKG